MRLENKVALITGAYGGMGRRVTRLLQKKAHPLSSLAGKKIGEMRWQKKSLMPEGKHCLSNSM